MSALQQVFGGGGPLASQLTQQLDNLGSYRVRPQQVEAAQMFEAAFLTGRHAIVEAGTGVGKSLAYLIPAARAIEAGAERVVVSTHSLALQEQLVRKDIPVVQQMYPSLRPHLMKGRANYLCLQGLATAREDVYVRTDDHWRDFLRWSGHTQTGDRAELAMPFPYWQDVRARRETCGGERCAYYDRCHFYRARAAAADCNLLVVNHALLMQDAALKSRGLRGILPAYDLLILDEAHHLLNIATEAFTVRMSEGRIPAALQQVTRNPRAAQCIPSRCLQEIYGLNRELFDILRNGLRRRGSDRAFLFEALSPSTGGRAIYLTQEIGASLESILASLEEAAENAGEPQQKGVLLAAATALGGVVDDLCAVLMPEDEDIMDDRIARDHIRECRISEGPGSDEEVAAAYVPVEVARILRSSLWARVRSCALASATLATCGGFGPLKRALGLPLEEGRMVERTIGSPFDYARNCMLFCPEDGPEIPAGGALTADYVERLSVGILRLAEMSGGGMFSLHSSRRAMDAVWARLGGPDGPLARRGMLPLKQGDAPAAELLSQFRANPRSVLFGLATFSEGVDVQGDALRVVSIDRLPFSQPDEPLTRARRELITRRGGNWWTQMAIPEAQTKLKQAFGRLIRSHTDKGVVAIHDTRLLEERLRKQVLSTFPPAARASKWDRLLQFWRTNVSNTTSITTKQEVCFA